MQTAAGAGVNSSVFLMSDDLDEIDWNSLATTLDYLEAAFRQIILERASQATTIVERIQVSAIHKFFSHIFAWLERNETCLIHRRDSHSNVAILSSDQWCLSVPSESDAAAPWPVGWRRPRHESRSSAIGR